MRVVRVLAVLLSGVSLGVSLAHPYDTILLAWNFVLAVLCFGNCIDQATESGSP